MQRLRSGQDEDGGSDAAGGTCCFGVLWHVVVGVCCSECVAVLCGWCLLLAAGDCVTCGGVQSVWPSYAVDSVCGVCCGSTFDALFVRSNQIEKSLTQHSSHTSHPALLQHHR